MQFDVPMDACQIEALVRLAYGVVPADASDELMGASWEAAVAFACASWRASIAADLMIESFIEPVSVDRRVLHWP